MSSIDKRFFTGLGFTKATFWMFRLGFIMSCLTMVACAEIAKPVVQLDNSSPEI